MVRVLLKSWPDKGNLLGWFLVAFLTILIFVIWQDYLSQKQDDIDSQVLLIPVIGYGFPGIVLIFRALRIDMSSLAAIGFMAMSPAVVVNRVLFLR